MAAPHILRKLFRRRIVLVAALALALVVAVALLAGPLSGLDPNETAVFKGFPWAQLVPVN